VHPRDCAGERRKAHKKRTAKNHGTGRSDGEGVDMTVLRKFNEYWCHISFSPF